MQMIRHFFELFRSQGGKNQVALAICLGMFCGISHFGWAHIVFFVVILIVFRVSLSAFFSSMALFYVPSEHAFHPLAYKIGLYLLESGNPVLTKTWQTIFSLPVISFFEFHRYVVLGSFILSMGIFPILYLLSSIAYNKISNSSLQSIFVKICHWLWGEQPFEANSFLRGRLLLYLLILFVMAFLGFSFSGGIFIKQILQKNGTEALGTNVAIKDVTINCWTGRVLLHSLEITDPMEKEEKLFTAELVEIDMSLQTLWQGKLVFDNVLVQNASLRLAQNEKGELNLSFLKPFQKRAEYLEKAKAMKNEELNVKPDVIAFIHRKDDLDWIGETIQWGAEQYLIEAYKDWLKLQKITEYATKHKASPEVIEALLPYSLEEVESLLDRAPDHIKIMLSCASYSQPVPQAVFTNVKIENLKLVLAIQSLKTFFDSNVELEKFGLGFGPSGKFLVYQLESPIKGKFTLSNDKMHAFSLFSRLTMPFLFENGKACCNANLEIDKTKQEFLVEGNLEFQDAKFSVNRDQRILSTGAKKYSLLDKVKEGVLAWFPEKPNFIIYFHSKNDGWFQNVDWIETKMWEYIR